MSCLTSKHNLPRNDSPVIIIAVTEFDAAQGFKICLHSALHSSSYKPIQYNSIPFNSTRVGNKNRPVWH